MFEAKVIAAFLADRKDYDNVVDYVKRDQWSPMGLAILETIDNYYSNDANAENTDIEVFRVALDRRFKDIPRHKEKARDFLEGVLNTDTSTINVIHEVVSQRRAEVGTQLADALLAQDEGRIEEYLQEYEALSDTTVLGGSVEEEYIGVTLDQLEEQFDTDGTWELCPAILRDKIEGNLRPGHAVIVAGRPERGKTLFGINFNSGFLQQGAKVLYIGNEDPVPDLVLRLLANLSGMSQEDMFKDKEKAMRIAIEKGYENCVFVGLSPGTLYEIEALVRRHTPDILIVDQMRNIRAKSENNTQRLEIVAQELRNIANRHGCVLMALTQVGDSGRDKLVLNDGDIDGSNTGIPGACDIIIMIGSDENYEKSDRRMLTLAKNKRGGDHSSFTVSVDRTLSRVTSIV